jgi:hypothetical protein
MGNEFNIDPGFARLFATLGLNAQTVFTDDRIHVWRSLPDRENATLDFIDPDGRPSRLHIKRYPPASGSAAAKEIHGYELLKQAGLPAAPIIVHGHRADGSSFIILQDLAGYTPGDKLIESGFAFDKLLNVTADLAALLHGRGLHHRDLYLCHFMIRADENTIDAKLIDMARVDRFRSVLTRRRWIVKDLAQFWYSTQSLPISDEQRRSWLARYCDQRQISIHGLIAPIQRKATAIGRHDVQLRRKQPGRNVSVAGLNSAANEDPPRG